MPLEANGEVTLSFWKGMACWGCVLLWMLTGYFIFLILNGLGMHEWWAALCGMTFQAFFGVVPALFFLHEERKCRG